MTNPATTAARYLYLARHGDAVHPESGEADDAPLSESGQRQATLLGDRLQGRPIAAIHHGPLPRAAQTARLVGERLPDSPLHCTELAGDYVPYVPDRTELPTDSADFLLRFLASVTASEREEGARLAREALERFTGPSDDGQERHELIVTHSFLIGWLVAHAMHAPPWRWLGLNHGNAALTVIRYTPGRPTSVLFHNDTRHLPAGLRSTGLPGPLP